MSLAYQHSFPEMSSHRVAVIGAGPAGLVAAKHSVNEGHHVVVYEQHSSVGGIWVFSEDPKHHSALYEDMKTNLPKEMMMYNGHPYPDELPSFMSSQNVLEYLEKYSDGLPIRFNTKVWHVSRKSNQWQIEAESQGKITTELFDAVFVCNGHYVQPRIPFDTTKFKGKLIHSHDYRRAKNFEGMRVAVVGTGPSGIDVALQLATSSREVLFIGNRAKYPVLPENVVQYSTHVVDMVDDRLILDSGVELSGVEAVVICTGYNMDFPFLEEGLVEVVHDGQMVSPLWQHVVHKDYPDSLFFIGLNLMVVTMTLFEHQVRFALSLVGKRTDIPSRAEMDDWEDRRMQFLEENGKTSKQFHSMTDDQWAYMDELADLGKFERWPHHKVMAKMYSYIFKARGEDVINYKNINFVVNGEDFTVVK